MKKILGLSIFLAVSLFSATFSYARIFTFTEDAGNKITIEVLGPRATITLEQIENIERRDKLSVWATKKSSNSFEDKIFEETFVIKPPVPQKKIFVVNNLEINKKYYLSLNKYYEFSTSPYGIGKGDETADGGHKFSAFGDPSDSRDMFLVLNKTLYPVGGDVLGWIGSSIIVPMGKFTGSPTGRTASVPITVPPEKSGRYFIGLVAKGADGSYSPIVQYGFGSVVFGTNKIGEIFFNKDLTYKNGGTGAFSLSGSLDASKHGPTDIVPLSSIIVSGEIYTPDGATVLYPLNPVKIESASAGKYTLGVQGANLNAGEWYPVKILFESKVSDGGTGAKAEYAEKFNTQKGIIPQTGEARDDFFDTNSYRLLAPIPGLVALLDPALCQLEQQRNPGQICDVNAFLNFILKLIIGLAAVVLVVRLIIEGYSYMITDTPFKKAAAKGDFKEALIGLVIALSSYLILNTINPRLVNNDVKIGVAEFEVLKMQVSEETYQRITGQSVLPKSKYVEIAQKIAKEEGVDECLLVATVTVESSWDPLAFNSDANLPTDDNRSRRLFVRSGEKYSGAKFTPNDNLQIDRKFMNDDVKNGQPVDPTKDTLGLDWRFSAGFGLLGITYFPEGFFDKNYNAPLMLKNKLPILDSVWPKNPSTSKAYTPKEIWDPETSLRLGAIMLKKKYATCGGNIKQTLASWNKGNVCVDNANHIDRRVAEYNKCKGIGTSPKTNPSTSNTGTKSILAMGDSITAATSGSTYIERFTKDKNWTVNNKAKDGETTIWMLARMKELEAEGKRYSVITIMGGTNDILKGFNQKYGYKITEKNIEAMIIIAKKISDRVIVISPPVQLSGFFHKTSASLTQAKIDLESLNSYLSRYPDIIHIDFYTLTKNRPELIGSDGVHPKPAGQQALFELLSQKIK